MKISAIKKEIPEQVLTKLVATADDPICFQCDDKITSEL